MTPESTAVLFACAIAVGSGMVRRGRGRRTTGVISPEHLVTTAAAAAVVLVQQVSGYRFDVEGRTVAMALAVVAVLSFVVTRFIRDNVDTEQEPGDDATGG